MTTSTHALRIGSAIAAVLVLSTAAFTQSLRAASPAAGPPDGPAVIDHSAPGGHGSSASAAHEKSPNMEHDGQAMMEHGGQAMMEHGGQPMMEHGGQAMMNMHEKHMAAASRGLPGQDAFGAIQEIVAQLDSDPTTDWSKVDLEALRQHLIDMSEVTLKADAAPKRIDGGLAITVTGNGRTVAAIQRMVPAHAQEINGANGWSARTEPLAKGVLLVVTAKDPKEEQRIRGLGFIGIMVTGSHHQAHHLAMARGSLAHAH